MSFASRHLLAASLALLLGQTAGADEIGRLVRQLGSDRFEEREAASLRLEEIGGPALPALEKAAGSPDAEIRWRASELVKILRVHIEAQRARHIIERAILALGGEAKLSRYKALRYKYRETFRLGPFSGVETGDCLIRYPCQFRRTTRVEVEVFDGKRRWFRRGYWWDEADEYLTSKMREYLHAMTVATLLPLLRGEGYTLSSVGGKDARGPVGVRVSHRGHRDVELYFDPGSGLLVRYETLVMKGDEEVRAESLLEGYADFGGIRRPRKVTWRLPGRPVEMVCEVSDYQAIEDVDDREFTKP
jgi:hypothetical protein